MHGVRNVGWRSSTGLPAPVPAIACTVAMDTPGVPPSPLPALLVHLCFVGALGVVATTIAAPSVMRVPSGIVTCLPCLAWTLVLE